MPSRAPAFRVVAVLLATLLSLTGAGASIAHGIAHVREHRAAEHHGGAEHHDDHDGAHEPPAPVAAATREAPGVGTPDEPTTHLHARLDALAVTRLAIAAFLPPAPVLVPAPPEIAATVEVPPAARPLRLAEPPTGPPPPSRAPPLG